MAQFPSNYEQDELVCNDNVPLSIITNPGINLRLSCSEGIWSIELHAFGGRGPYNWVTDKGKITSSGSVNQDALIQLNAAIDDNLALCIYGEHVGELLEQLGAYRILCRDYYHLLSGGGASTPCVPHPGASNGIYYNCSDQLMGGATDQPFTDELANTPFICRNHPIDLEDPIGPAFGPCDDLPYCDASGPVVGCLITTEGSMGPQSIQECTSYLFHHPELGLRIDDRTEDMKNRGCWPCSLHINEDILVTMLDAEGTIIFTTIHIDA